MPYSQEKLDHLARRAGVSPAQAAAALEQAEGELLQAALLLEQWGKCAPLAGGFYTTRPGAGACRPSGQAGQQGEGTREQSWKSWGRQLLHALAGLLRHCTVNQLEIWRKGVEVSSIPVVIVILLLLAAFWLMLLLLLAGAAAGCSYRFTGPGLDAQGLNDLLARGTEFLRQQAALLHREFSGKHKGRGRGKQRRP